jgi:hypothetical protein
MLQCYTLPEPLTGRKATLGTILWDEQHPDTLVRRDRHREVVQYSLAIVGHQCQKRRARMITWDSGAEQPADQGRELPRQAQLSADWQVRRA